MKNMFLENKDINTGRQPEFDYLKGLFVPMIILIHAFQLLGGTTEPLYEVFYPICTMTGSTIFLFVMGMGSTYSRSSEKQMILSGVKLIAWQIVWNVFALALPFLMGQGIRAFFGLSMEMWPMAVQQVMVLLQYINIFFIAGVIYLFLAFFKKIRLPAWGYLVIAAVVMVATPWLYMVDWKTGIPAVDYTLTLFFGGRDSVSLVFLPHFVYSVFGVWFGRILRRTADKKRLYLTFLPGALVIGIAYLVYSIVISDTLTDFCNFVSYEYTFPGIFRMLTNLSWVLVTAGALWSVHGWIKKYRLLDNLLLHFNKKTSAYYGIHPFLYALAGSIAITTPFGWLPCFVIAVADTIFCWLVMRLWEKIKN